MKKLTNLALGTVAVASLFSATASADHKYSWGNVSLNYLDWDAKTENTHGKDDFPYIELEAGAGFTWGDLYGFIDFESPDRLFADKDSDKDPSDAHRIAAKIVGTRKLGETGFSAYGQVYHLSSDGFAVTNVVGGAAYDYRNGGFWIRPWLGKHYQIQTYYSGDMGFMGGVTWTYNFKLFGEKFMAAQWHEYEFKRDGQHFLGKDDNGNIIQVGDGRSEGHNGAVSIWWHMTDALTTGFQYRYADHKLGSNAYIDAFIYSIKYNF